MPVTIEIVDAQANQKIFDEVFDYFQYVDEKFSTYKDSSEIMRINAGELKPSDYSQDVKTILALAEEAKKETEGYFDINLQHNIIDPSGLVKGWTIYNAAKILESKDFKNFYIVAGGDIQVCGANSSSQKWHVGIKNPFNTKEIIKIVYVTNQGVATSGTYEQGQHIYNPLDRNSAITDIVSLTVIGPNIYQADKFATAAFAMGMEGINFIEKLEGYQGYLVDKNGMATKTSGFEQYCKE